MSKIITCYPNLHAELARCKLLKAEVAAMAKINSTTFSYKLRGKSEFTLAEMERIRAALTPFTDQELTLDYLFKR